MSMCLPLKPTDTVLPTSRTPRGFLRRGGLQKNILYREKLRIERDRFLKICLASQNLEVL
jgi:hypothetical protein